MKIWYQMGGTYRYGDFYEDFAKRLEARVQEIVRPDTEVYITGLPKMQDELAQYKFIEYYHKNQIINNMYRAKREGYDAFVIAFPMDAGLDEGRELLDMPVVGIFQSTVMMAAMLGYRFTAVTMSDYLCERYRQMAAHYGLGGRWLPGNYWMDSSREAAYHGYDQLDSFKKNFTEVARQAIHDGASAIIPLSNGVLSQAYASGLTKSGIDGVPVLDCVAIALKTAEALVDLKKLGVTASRKLQVYGKVSDELAAKTLKTYEDTFKIEY